MFPKSNIVLISIIAWDTYVVVHIILDYTEWESNLTLWGAKIQGSNQLTAALIVEKDHRENKNLAQVKQQWT